MGLCKWDLGKTRKPLPKNSILFYFFHILKGIRMCNVIGLVYVHDLVWLDSCMEFEILFLI